MDRGSAGHHRPANLWVWSGGVFDLEKEPLVSYHESDGRYFVVQLLNMWTDDFASLGTRVSGNAGGHCLRSVVR